MIAKTQIELLIFDAGHVLIDFDWKLVKSGFAERARRPYQDLASVMGHMSSLGYEHGRISTLDFLAELNSQLQSDLTLEEFKAIWIVSLEENLAMAKLLQLLKTQVSKMYLLSNTNEIHWNEIHSRFNIARHFDELVLSHTIGLAKPEPEIYEHVLELSGVPASKSLFVDDLETNIRAAEQLGINSILFRGVDDFKTQLQSYGFSLTNGAE